MQTKYYLELGGLYKKDPDSPEYYDDKNKKYYDTRLEIMSLVLIISLFITYISYGLTINNRDAVNNAIYPTNELERKNLELTKQDYKDFRSATINFSFYSAIIAGIIPLIIMIVNIKNFINKREHYLSFGIELKRMFSKDKKLSLICFELGYRASIHLRSVF